MYIRHLSILVNKVAIINLKKNPVILEETSSSVVAMLTGAGLYAATIANIWGVQIIAVI